MPSTLTLASLPPDIKQMIVRIEENSMDNIRQISHSWNSIVLDYLKTPSFLLPIDRVYFSSGLTNPTYDAYGAQDPEMKWANKNARKLVHMYAIIPEQRTTNVGLGKWLKVHQRFPEECEVTCDPQKIAMSPRLWKQLVVRNWIFVVLACAFYLIGCATIGEMIVVVARK